MLHFPRWKAVLVWLVCLAGLVFASPNFLPTGAPRVFIKETLGLEPVNLGLDLQGGVYLLLEVDIDGYLEEQVKNIEPGIRVAYRQFREVGYRGDLAINGMSVRFSVSAKDNLGPLLSELRSLDKGVTTQSIEKDTGTEITVSYSDIRIQEIKKELIAQSIEVLRRRVDETGTREPIIQQQGENRILLQVPGLSDPEKLKKIIRTTAKLTFHMVDDSVDREMLQLGKAPRGTVVRYAEGNPELKLPPIPYALQERAMLTGEMLVSANATYDQGKPVVSFRFNTIGARKFADITQQNVNRLFAIVLDEVVISAPVIREPILGGSGIISGGFTPEESQNLALLLRAGALPADLHILEERTVGPSLGADSIRAGTYASALSIILVMVFMFMAYRMFGIFSNTALLINIMLLLAALSLLQATLTLPGIAGIILTMGMAVDANVLIFERIREEIRLGKKIYSAVEHGFNRAFTTIIDSNITTLIAAVILFTFGSGTVKGFAVTLSLGILASMFSAIMFTRMLVIWWIRRRPTSYFAEALAD